MSFKLENELLQAKKFVQFGLFLHSAYGNTPLQDIQVKPNSIQHSQYM